MSRLRASGRGDSGETLIELLMSVAILGLTASAIVGAVMLGTSSSTIDRSTVQVQRMLKAWGEQVVDATTDASYTDCATTSASPWSSGKPAASGFTASVQSVQYWNGSAFTSGTGTGGACVVGTDDKGVQRVQLRVTYTGTPSVTADYYVTVRKPCVAC